MATGTSNSKRFCHKRDYISLVRRSRAQNRSACGKHTFFSTSLPANLAQGYIVLNEAFTPEYTHSLTLDHTELPSSKEFEHAYLPMGLRNNLTEWSKKTVRFSHEVIHFDRIQSLISEWADFSA